MKKYLILLFLLVPTLAFLQPSKDTSAPYFKNNSYPEIQLLLTDSSTVFTKENIPTDKTVALIFFSPDCDHCQKTVQELITKMDSLTNLIMVLNGPSYITLHEIKEFYQKYKLESFPNIIMGKETRYFVPIHYRIEVTPYAAIYKEGKFYTEFRNGFTARNLIDIAHNNYSIPAISDEPVKKKKGKN